MSWTTLRGQQCVLAQGTGHIAVLDSVIKCVYTEMKTEVSPKTSFFIETLNNERLNVCFAISCQPVMFAVC